MGRSRERMQATSLENCCAAHPVAFHGYKPRKLASLYRSAETTNGKMSFDEILSLSCQ